MSGHQSCACKLISFSRIVRVWTDICVNVISKTTTTQGPTRCVRLLCRPVLCLQAVDIMDVDSAAVRGGTGSAVAERRLRQHWRHEQLTLQMLLATYQHHAVPRGQTTARSGEWGSEVKYTAMFPGAPSPGGRHPVLCHGRG